jgi:hypothetical protein
VGVSVPGYKVISPSPTASHKPNPLQPIAYLVSALAKIYAMNNYCSKDDHSQDFITAMRAMIKYLQLLRQDKPVTVAFGNVARDLAWLVSGLDTNWQGCE